MALLSFATVAVALCGVTAVCPNDECGNDEKTGNHLLQSHARRVEPKHLS